LHKLK